MVKDVYMDVEEGWEDAPSEKLKYPVMELKDDTFVYNRGGLSSALGYAKTEGNKDVVNKVESIYKKLDLDDGKGGDKKMEDAKKLAMKDVKHGAEVIKEVQSQKAKMSM